MNPCRAGADRLARRGRPGQPLATVFAIVNERTRKPADNPAERVLAHGKVVGLANHTDPDRPRRPRAARSTTAPHRSATPTAASSASSWSSATSPSAVRAERESRRERGTQGCDPRDRARLRRHHRSPRQHPRLQPRRGAHVRLPARRRARPRDGRSDRAAGRCAKRTGAGMERYIRTGAGSVLGQRLELTAMHANGNEFPVEIAVTRISGEGAPVFTGYLRDITERRGMEDRLQQYVADLSEMDRRKNEFLATLSHELRNPLAPMRNAVEIVRMSTGELGGRAVRHADDAAPARADGAPDRRSARHQPHQPRHDRAPARMVRCLCGIAGCDARRAPAYSTTPASRSSTSCRRNRCSSTPIRRAWRRSSATC